ncbi:MAG TPA: acyl-CoA dehydrogenase family protein [Trueperaceae bacterium]|nr:acyl-CoA dehydrogenase family protein [Trueperaceae bacterium]
MTLPATAAPDWFDLTDDQRALIGPLREVLREEVAPGAAERDATGEFPHDLVKRLGELGLFGLQVPERYGGAGLDTTTAALVVEEVAAVDGSLALTVASHNSLCLGHLLRAADERQLERWVPPLATAERLGAWCLTETGAGSDAAAIATRARQEAGAWVVNGSKVFITQGTVAGTYVVMARTSEPAEGRERSHGISAFVADGATPGLVRGKPEKKLGLASSDTTPLTFEGMTLPPDALLGREGEAFADVSYVLTGGRIGIGAMGIGLGRAALETALAYAAERRQFGKPIARHQAIAFKLAEMAMELEAARLLVRKAAALRDAGREHTAAAAMAKLKGSTAGVAACDAAIQVLGGYGYTKEYPVERYWRDARLTRIGEGTDEIQHLIIARDLLRSVGA